MLDIKGMRVRMVDAQPRPKVVLAHGCFDLLHLGHVRYLQAAKKMGDHLVVSVTSDRHVRKGPGRPQFTQDERCEALWALACVDEVLVSDAPNAVDVIERVRPDLYVKGQDYASATLDENLDAEVAAVHATGGKFVTTDTRRWSSTQLLRASRLSEEARDYCASAKSRGFLRDINAAFYAADKLKIAFVGETIVDEYRYVTPLAKPAKEHILAVADAGKEQFNGGIAAASRHGEWPNARMVTPFDTIKKTRFVNEGTSRKLFEVYSHTRVDGVEPTFRQELAQAVLECDVCVVIDFGHGAMGDMERAVTADAKFLAVACQNNAGNYGFNSVLKYDSADYVCVDEPEARLSVGEQTIDVARVLELLRLRSHATYTIITRGHAGSLPYPGVKVPAFADHGLDTMGAGDAFLAVTAPLIAAGLDAEKAAFVGNVAGAIKIGIPGHRDHVRRADLMRNIEQLVG